MTRIVNPGLPALLGPVPLSFDSQVCVSQRNPPLPPSQRSNKKKNTVHNPLSQERVKFLEKLHRLCDHSLSIMGSVVTLASSKIYSSEFSFFKEKSVDLHSWVLTKF